MRRSKAAFALVLIGGALGALVVACSSFGSADASDAETEASTPADAQVVDSGGDALAPPVCISNIDLKSDSLNCGRCAHSCLGGKCDAGVCQPVVMGTTTGEGVIDVAVDGTRVFWLTSNSPWDTAGHVYGCPKSGCPATGPAIVAGAPEPVQTGNLVGDGKDAYFSVVFSGDPHISKLAADGTLPRVGTAHGLAVRLQLVAGTLYYTSIDEKPNMFGHAETLFRWDGTTETSIARIDTPSNFLFFEVAAGNAFFADTVSIQRCAVSGCPALEPLVPQGSILSMTTDGTSIFWGDNDDSVSSCIAAGTGECVPTSVVESANLEGAMPLDVVFDHGTLYVATSSNAIFACQLPDCAKTLTKLARETRLYQGNEALYGHTLAADDTAFYWAAVDTPPDATVDGGEDVTLLTHRIMKLAK